MNLSELRIELLLPEILLFSLACVILLADLFLKNKSKKFLWDISYLGLLIVLFTIIQPFISQRWDGGGVAFFGQAYADSLSIFIRLIITSTLFTSLIFSYEWLENRPDKSGVFLFLTMISALGGMILANAGDLLILLIGLEILSLPLYVLAGFERKLPEGREASFKYFILGSFASAFLALGIVLVYGSAATINFQKIIEIGAAGGLQHISAMKIGIAVIVASLAFKGGLMPFYAWIPDVYRGSPDYVVGFMAAVAKTAVFGILIRLSIVFIPIAGGAFIYILGFLFLVTVVIGNLMALWQTDVKRMLAYSSIAHAGYLVLGLMAYGSLGFSSIIFYLLIYSFVVIGSFIITGFVGKYRGGYELDHFNGLYKRRPVMAFLMSAFMFALAGIPPVAGFWSKMFLFNAGVDADFEEFAVIGVLASIVGVYYYLRVIVRIYMNPVKEEIEATESQDTPGFFTKTALILSGVIIILLGLFPGPFYDSATVFMDLLLK